jgi:RNA polymerase sigma factor (sigma-70 family)
MTRRTAPNAAPSSERERVERAAAILSRLEHEVLVLSAGHGLRTAEIASRLGISEGRVERILARALRKFSRAMEEPGRGGWRWWRR